MHLNPVLGWRSTKGISYPSVLSGYGLHLVFLEERVDGRIPIWTEVRDRLVMDFNRMRSDRSKDALYEGLSAKYEIVIDES